ncbi:MAG TPA: hypothetical protein VFQ53_36145 [Kofleriaceae bacterium]|nr:hypothetical protein [Kofleriaceae bacterium]
MATTHPWHFFRAGGVDQVSLRTADDLRSLGQLDQKLWVALAMPTTGVDLDPETLALVDLHHDGRIRVTDVIDAVTWADATFVKLEELLRSSDEVKLSAIKDDKVLAAAKRMLSDLGKPDATAISVTDTNAITRAFSATKLNGDGVVIPESTDDAELARAIVDAIKCAGATLDRSGKDGIDQLHADAFFAAVDQRAAWIREGRSSALAPLGDATATAAEAYAAVRDKLDDYFTRCRVAAFDPRGATALGGQDDELVKLASRSLSASDEELARLPLAKIDAAGKLGLAGGLNPAWADRIATFVQAAVTPIVGARKALVPDDVAQVSAKLAAFDKWRRAEPKTIVDALDPAWIEKLASSDLRIRMRVLIRSDAALAGEYDQITSVAKVVRLQRDFGRLLRNFVNFSDFYSKQDGVFQAGTLYLDARALHLCVPVADAAKHAALATSSDSHLVYCDISRQGVTKQIAAALTNGDADNIFIGRNGIFYDRAGNDWDATVTKVVANPISIREAFWTPYKKLVKTIEDNVTRRVSAADADATAKLDAVGKTVSTADKAATPAPPHPVRKVDLGTVAAIGVAIGGIGTLVGTMLGVMFGLGVWLPFGILALLLLISGPSMILAWLKLHRRNLGPILDANGWAINGRARINVPFGAAMTELARLPPGSQRSFDDPFAEKRTPWRRYVALALLLILLGTWYVGRLDDVLPEPIRSTTVLGKYAPSSQPP